MLENPLEQFRKEAVERACFYKNNDALQKSWENFLLELNKAKYAYNFFWLGLPIIQIPQDIQALQEIIWEVKPDLIIETGVAWGGSLIFSASMLAILEVCGVIEKGEVIGIDIDVRPHNKKSIASHPLSKKLTIFEGSSIDENIIGRVKERAKNKRVMVCLDSNHTHDHVLAELKAYANLVSVGSYCMVGDTGVEDLPEGTTNDRPWGKGDNPKTAVREFLKQNDNFIIDKTIDSKLIITGSPDGYLKRIR
ncbi:MAG: cephalosporin hydroxylase family protein [Desulfamplus sp.]